jgi:hypothetical protein
MQDLKSVPAHCALDLFQASLFGYQHLQGFAVELIVGFKFADREAG